VREKEKERERERKRRRSKLHQQITQFTLFSSQNDNLRPKVELLLFSVRETLAVDIYPKKNGNSKLDL
jgi:hypothetical protein